MTAIELEQLCHWIDLGICKVQAALGRPGPLGRAAQIHRLEVPAVYADKVAQVARLDPSLEVIIERASEHLPTRWLRIRFLGEH